MNSTTRKTQGERRLLQSHPLARLVLSSSAKCSRLFVRLLFLSALCRAKSESVAGGDGEEAEEKQGAAPDVEDV
jgi:hypothetical protein